MIEVFKKPLVENNDCEACIKKLFKPLHMPQCVYDKVHKYPMPIPIPMPTFIGTRLRTYTTFEEAHVLLFTFEHQPSLKATSLRIAIVAKKREAIARSELEAARVATSLSSNITKLKNKTAFKIASST